MTRGKIVVMLLAGGKGSRLNILAHGRAKPAVPFGGIYRIIDFTLSNAMHSGLNRVGLLTQYRPTSLIEHVGNGISWDLHGKYRGVKVLPPQTGSAESDWYKGTADAVYQNLSFIEDHTPSHVVILSGDHIYNMDYAAMIAHHEEIGADLTIAAMEVPWEEASRFGTIVEGSDGSIEAFEEKPAKPRSNLASMGIYVFRADALYEELTRANAERGFDFGGDVIPAMLGSRKLTTYRFKGYWRDVGTIASYWEAHQDMLQAGTGLDPWSWRPRTNLSYRGLSEIPPARITGSATVGRSLVSRGSIIEGTVIDSVLSPLVRVAPGAVVKGSVIMHNAVIGEGAVVDRVVMDKDCVIGAGAKVGFGDGTAPNEQFPAHLDTGITLVGKQAVIPDGVTIGRNVLVAPGARPDMFGSGTIIDGESVGS